LATSAWKHAGTTTGSVAVVGVLRSCRVKASRRICGLEHVKDLVAEQNRLAARLTGAVRAAGTGSPPSTTA
jgi:hypothetical protein